MTPETEDRLAIRDLIENWAVLRDARLWDEFRKVWHDDGVMQATWFQGTADEFIKVSQEGYDKGVRILHFLGVLRQPIYEKDRCDPVDTSATLKLDQDILKLYPEGYRHLAYLQHKIGYKVKRDMPGLDGPEVEALYARGKGWLAGKAL
jgi:hypothetical protein